MSGSIIVLVTCTGNFHKGDTHWVFWYKFPALVSETCARKNDSVSGWVLVLARKCIHWAKTNLWKFLVRDSSACVTPISIVILCTCLCRCCVISKNLASISPKEAISTAWCYIHVHHWWAYILWDWSSWSRVWVKGQSAVSCLCSSAWKDDMLWSDDGCCWILHWAGVIIYNYCVEW